MGLFNQGSAARQTVTMSMVTRRIEQLLAHRSGCCGRCEFAVKARAEHVFRIVGGGSGDTGRRAPSAEHRTTAGLSRRLHEQATRLATA